VTLNEPTGLGKRFTEGATVRLADGNDWVLPAREPYGHDHEYDALLDVAARAEDRSEFMRAGLALTICLLHRHYALTPERIEGLLLFAPGDGGQEALQHFPWLSVMVEYSSQPHVFSPP